MTNKYRLSWQSHIGCQEHTALYNVGSIHGNKLFIVHLCMYFWKLKIGNHKNQI